jgi:hypothetical protein
MGKSKSGTALFDLLGKDESDKPEIRRSAVRSTPGEIRPQTVPPDRTEPDSVVGAPKSALGGRIGGTSPAVELDDERIRFSLTSFSAAIVVFVVLVTALGAFELGRNLGGKAGFQRGVVAGRASYEAKANDDIEAARRMPANTKLVEDLLLESSKPAAEQAATSALNVKRAAWIRGHTYIIVQEFRTDHVADADRAQAYLAEHGVETERIALASGSVQLVTTQGYNRSDPTQSTLADQLLKKVKSVGKSYFADRGGYRLEGYFKTLKSDSW